jgi:hypothetical protein
MRVQLIFCFPDGTWESEIFQDPKVKHGPDGNLHNSHYADAPGVQSVFQIGNDVAFAELIRKVKQRPKYRSAVFVGVAKVFLKHGPVGWKDVCTRGFES